MEVIFCRLKDNYSETSNLFAARNFTAVAGDGEVLSGLAS